MSAQKVVSSRVLEKRAKFFQEAMSACEAKSMPEMIEMINAGIAPEDELSAGTLQQVRAGYRSLSPTLVDRLKCHLPNDLDFDCLTNPDKPRSNIAKIFKDMTGAINKVIGQNSVLLNKDVADIFQQLGDGDVYCLFLSSEDEEPLEFQPKNFELAVAARNAILEGATFLYVAPERSKEASRLPLRHKSFRDKHLDGENVPRFREPLFVKHQPFSSAGFKHCLFMSENIPGHYVATTGFETGGDDNNYLHVVVGPEIAKTMMLFFYDNLTTLKGLDDEVYEVIKNHIVTCFPVLKDNL